MQVLGGFRAAPRTLTILGAILVGALPTGCDRHPTFDADPAPIDPTPFKPAVPSTLSSRDTAELVGAFPPQTREKQIADLRREAGFDEVPPDPAAPAGDLKSDVASFTSLDACVHARALRDPLLADAIEALGYDTLLRDACRTLQALKTMNTAACSAILATGLRSRCQSDVAIGAARPEWCATRSEGRFNTHDPSCVARAMRDVRLCAAVMAAEQPLCRALVLDTSAECGNDSTCKRHVARWRGFTSSRPTAKTDGRRGPSNNPSETGIHVTVVPVVADADASTVKVGRPASDAAMASSHADNLSSDAATPATDFRDVVLDFPELARTGVLIKKAARQLEIIVGNPPSRPGWSIHASTPQPQLYLDAIVSSDPEGTDRASTSRASVELFVPGAGRFSSLPTSSAEVANARLAATVGAPTAFELSMKLQNGGRPHRVKIAIQTYVRDVIGQ